MNDAAPDQVEARKQRLLSEITEERLVVLQTDELYANGGTAEQKVNFVVDEILHARHIRPHEGRRPPYGCLIVADATSVTERAAIADISGNSTTVALDALRPYANGQDTFLVRGISGNARIVVTDQVDELALVRKCREHNAVSIQRLEDGRVVVGTATTITTDAGYSWATRAHGRRLIRPVAEVLGADTTDLAGIAELLDFAVHFLSPNGFGATFALALDDTKAESLVTSISNYGHRLDFDLNAFKPDHQRALGSLLASEDGACLLEADGRVFMYEAILRNSNESEVVPRQSSVSERRARSRRTVPAARCAARVFRPETRTRDHGGRHRDHYRRRVDRPQQLRERT